jgi:hypothetical protein
MPDWRSMFVGSTAGVFLALGTGLCPGWLGACVGAFLGAGVSTLVRAYRTGPHLN